MDLRACDMENTIYVELKQLAVTPEKKTNKESYVTTKVKDCCVVCKADRHLLHAFKSFQAFPNSNKVAIIRKSRLYLDCLKPGHLVWQCCCVLRCKVCRGPHHSSLHTDWSHKKKLNGSVSTSPGDKQWKGITTHTSSSGSHNEVLFSTCKVEVIRPNGSTHQARVLLDFPLSTCFIMKWLDHQLHLPHRHHGPKVSCIGSGAVQSGQGTLNFKLSSTYRGGKSLHLEAILLCSVPFDQEWKHLVGLLLADSNFGVAKNIDILWGDNFFSLAVIQGPILGPPGTPTMINTCFGWALIGTVWNGCTPKRSTKYASMLLKNHLTFGWQYVWEVLFVGHFLHHITLIVYHKVTLVHI